MAEHITACVSCGDELNDEIEGAYCSHNCKHKNEQPMDRELDSAHFAALEGMDESGRY